MQLPLQFVSKAEDPVEQNVFGAIQDSNMSLTVLKDPKLLSNIFDAIEHSVGSSKEYLLWVALTCTSFRDPALNALWRSLDSFLPLLKLLSPLKVVNGVYVRSDPF
jgi:hypothetical protein